MTPEPRQTSVERPGGESVDGEGRGRPYRAPKIVRLGDTSRTAAKPFVYPSEYFATYGPS